MPTGSLLSSVYSSPLESFLALMVITLGAYVYFKWKNKSPRYPNYDKLFRDL